MIIIDGVCCLESVVNFQEKKNERKENRRTRNVFVKYHKHFFLKPHQLYVII